MTLPAAVVGMALLTLIAAGLHASYQRSQAHKRQRLQRLMSGARRAEALLAQLADVSLSRDLRVLLREEIRDRYRLVARMHPRYPQIDRLIEQAEQRRNAEGSDVGQTLPVPADHAVFEQWQAGLRELLLIVQSGGLLRPLPAELRARYREHLLERQAESLFGHFMNQADKFKGEGRQAMARIQVQQLTEWLRSLAIKSERTQGLLAEAEEAYQYLLHGAVAAADEGVAGG